MEALRTFRWKKAELFELRQHDSTHIRRQGECRQTLMGVETLSVIVEYEDDLILDIYFSETFRELH
ncbi:hypothetical protein AA0242T_2890 [Acetobacter aceti NRIC 0242]|nr:hypothetical protein AA0242T_2890 [Acetobacter aceti NRIC 0242]